jgi:pimeloyl-ACP methyl ester carboxylesterase
MTAKYVFRLFLIGLLAGAVGAGVVYFDDLGIREIPLETLQAKYEKPTSAYISVDGTNIHYSDQGRGPTIVALHGVADSLYTWDGWVDALADDYRIVRMDIPGFGLTGPARNNTYSEEAFVGFLDKFVAGLGLERFILVGNSLGGAIAWNYALRFPDKVDRMILIDPAGYPMDLPGALNLAAVPVLRDISMLVTPRFIFRVSLEQVMGDPDKVTDELVDRTYELTLRPGNRKALAAVLASLIKMKDDPELSKRIPGITVPTLLLWGADDRWIPPDHVALWKRDLPGIQTIVYQGVGHIPQVEIPGRSAADAHRWLSALEAEKRDGSAAMIFYVISGCFVGAFIALLAVSFWRRKD